MGQQHDAPKRPRPRRGLRALAEAVGPLAEPILKRRGLAMATVVRAWPEIVGETLAGRLAPGRLVFARGQSAYGTLHLHLSQSALATEVLHAAPVLIERINATLGYGAVARLKLVHDAPEVDREATPPPRRRPLTPDEERALAGQLATIADPHLRQVLESLGRNALARSPATPAAALGTRDPGADDAPGT